MGKVPWSWRLPRIGLTVLLASFGGVVMSYLSGKGLPYPDISLPIAGIVGLVFGLGYTMVFRVPGPGGLIVLPLLFAALGGTFVGLIAGVGIIDFGFLFVYGLAGMFGLGIVLSAVIMGPLQS